MKNSYLSLVIVLALFLSSCSKKAEESADLPEETAPTEVAEEQDSEWTIAVEGFVPAYFDKGRKAYAINTVEQTPDKWAAATKIFEQEDGVYDMTLTTLLETDGECSYKVFVDDEKVLSVTNPRIHGTDTEEYAPIEHIVEKVSMKKGSQIRVEFLSSSNGLVPEGDAFGYARARWTGLAFTPAAAE
ncbi:hypothetical protein R9C00_17475 [Flammeovirgaceae bacterium SG7u.111]|nr:hypothetical protein [Flammeovirgaceae bacterium SG7u.132]WPO33494.1 hypothetical protein R9C00_17475 [Flammeovirgaceae bacterium SG7u.111]